MSNWRTISHGADGRKVVVHTSLEPTSFLYHYLPWKYALLILEHQRLRLSAVQSWSDPYERWWCRQLFSSGRALQGVNAYGLCWTTSHFDEPMWRMNGFKRDPVVRIRSRTSSLLAAARRADVNASIYLAGVTYRPERALKQRAIAHTYAKQSSREATQLLLLKRNAFRFENEIRLVWLDREPEAGEQFLPINRADICQVMINPHSDLAERNMIGQQFKNIGVRLIASKLLELEDTMAHPAE